MADLSEQASLEHLKLRLSSTYADLPQDRIASAIHSAHARFEHSPIRDFVPLLVERRARGELGQIVTAARG
jgi:hypothetical protein